MPVLVGTNGVLAQICRNLAGRCNVYAMMMKLMERKENLSMRKSEVAALR